MHGELERALSFGPEWLLAKFANLPTEPSDTKSAEEFRKVYCDLWPGLAPKNYWRYVFVVRYHWTAKTESEKSDLPYWVLNVLTRNIATPPPAKLEKAVHVPPVFQISLQAGTIQLPIAAFLEMVSRPGVQLKVETLLDYLAVWLFLFRDKGKLAICERKDCPHPYYVKQHPRSRYCSKECSHNAELTRKVRWWKQNPGTDSKRRKKKASSRREK